MPRYAAVDFGSNSVRMQAAEVVPAPGGTTSSRILAAERQVTRLGEGVFGSGWITKEAMELTCEVLQRMAQVYRKPRKGEADHRRVKPSQSRQLYQELRERDLAERQRITGIGPRRAEIIIAGAAVLLHVMDAFRLPSFYYSAAGVRDGIIADLAARGVGRELSELNREQRRAVEETIEPVLFVRVWMLR